VYPRTLRARGDIAVWRRGDGEVDHTGYVAHRSQDPRVLLVWSMWGGLGEFRHPVQLSPYTDGCNVEYWRWH